MEAADLETETTQVKTLVLNKLLELSESMLNGDYTQRVITDFDEELLTKIVDNFNRLADKVQLNTIGENQEDSIGSFIQVISSFANLDFKQKLPISENGTIMDAIATGINILGEELEQSTASKQELEIERNRLNEAQAIAKVGSWELDIPSFHLRWSTEAFRIFGLGPISDNLLFEACTKKIHPEDATRVDDQFKNAAENGQDFVLEHRILSDHGSVKFILCIGEAVKNNEGKTICLKGTIQDITERKRVEETLKKAKENAEEANSAKGLFLANMSHEIRTPLNGILGLTEIMLGEGVTEAQRNYLEIISSSGKNLTLLINDILDFSKIESGKLQLENLTFNFKEVIASNIKRYNFLAKQKGLTLSYFIDESIPKEVIGDPARLSQVLTNLIGNAIKFTETGTVEVTLSLIESRNGEVVIRGVVKDTGIGIPKEKESSIFQSFTQADDAVTRKYGGTGLGLSIVKSLLKQMKGDISVQSPTDLIANTGSAFTFSVRLQVPEKQTPGPSATRPSEIRVFRKPLHFLIVDDNAVNLLVAKKMVQKFGARVTTAKSGTESIKLVKAKASEYDMVLMDIQMPELDGHQATRELRKLNYTRPIVALSANAYDDDVQNSLNAGMNDHLQKPYTEEKLFQMIVKYLE